MSFTVRVFYARCIEIERGTQVKILGDYTKMDAMRATLIHDERRGITFQLHPDEISDIELFTGDVHWPTPLRGQVISSIQWGGTTSLEIFPDWTPLLEYNRLSAAQAHVAVPAFWQLVDEKRRWESCLRETEDRFWKLRFQRPQPLDVSNAVLAMRRYKELNPTFREHYCTRYLWQSIEKQYLAARHLERLKVLFDLRRHFDALPRRDNRDWLIRRTEEEASALFEYTVPILYSALDVLAHVINEVYELGFSSVTVGFIGVTAGKVNVEGDSTRDLSLGTRFPEHPLTLFLLKERQDWIREVEVWRHHIIHHGTVEGGFWVELISDAESVFPKCEREGEAQTLLEDWNLRLWKLQEQVALSLEQFLDGQSEALIANGVTKSDSVQRKPDESQAIEVIKSFLDLWQQISVESDSGDNTQQVSFLYSRLTLASRRQWPFPQFCGYITNHPLLEWDFFDGFGWSSSPESGEQYSFCAQIKFAAQTILWRFILKPTDQQHVRKLAIDLTDPLCHPQSLTHHFKLLRSRSQQSNSDTGYHDLDYVIEIKNLTSEALQHVTVYTFWADIQGDSVDIGFINAGESRECELTWGNAFVPAGKDLPIVAPQIQREAYIRVIYHLEREDGAWWAEDFPIPMNESDSD